MGWPLDNDTGGGLFMYHWGEQFLLHRLCRPSQLQKSVSRRRSTNSSAPRHHPSIATFLEGGKRIGYGARAITEGGLQSVPKLAFPGGALIGCAAGFMNLPRIKGSHNAMKTGMLAAEAAFAALGRGPLAATRWTAMRRPIARAASTRT